MAQSVRFHYSNLLADPDVVFTESSEASDLPSSNVGNPQRTRVWRTGSSTATEYVVADLGSAQAVTSIVVDNHTLTSGDSAIKIQGNATDDFTSPSFSQTITYAATTMYAAFASQSYRYWRFVFTKSIHSETRDIGNIFLGTYSTPTRDPDRDGYSYEQSSRSVTRESIGGQSYSWQRDPVARIGLRWSRVDSTHKGIFSTLAAAVDTHTPFYLYLANVHDTPVQVKLAELPAFPITGGTSSAYRYDATLKMVTQL